MSWNIPIRHHSDFFVNSADNADHVGFVYICAVSQTGIALKGIKEPVAQ